VLPEVLAKKSGIGGQRDAAVAPEARARAEEGAVGRGRGRIEAADEGSQGPFHEESRS